MGLPIPQSTMNRSVNAIDIYRGQNSDIQLNLKTPSTDVDCNPKFIPFDLTGCTLYFTVKLRGNSRPLISKDSTDSSEISIISPSTCGQAIIYLLPTDTSMLDIEKYYYDVWVVTGTAATYPVIKVSEFNVLLPITEIS